MNVSELKKATLLNMNEKADEQTLLELGDEILDYINQGYQNAMSIKIKPVKSINCKSVGGRIPLSDIGDDYCSISRISDEYGMERRYTTNNDYIYVEDGNYEVEYIYSPSNMEKDDDVPLIPASHHYILSDYATYRMFMKGSKSRQARGDVFLSSYLNGLSSLSGRECKYILNKYGSEAIG